MANPWEDFTETNPWGDFDPSAIQQIDQERGAPTRIRSAVGASKKPDDKLATLQKYYPDATPWGVDNFVFTDPDTKNKTLFNPKGLDMGDVSESARMLFEFVGGSIGAGAAVVAGQLGPQIATPEEIITVPLAAGLGAAAGGQVYDVMADMFYPHEETRTFLQETADVGIEVLANTVGHRVGDLLEAGVKKGLSKGAALARTSGDEIFKAFNRMGVTPTAGAVSGNVGIQGIEQALAKLPSSADIVGTKYGQLIEDMGTYAEKLAGGLSPIEGKEAAGEALRRGFGSFVSRFKAQADELYTKVDDFIPGSKKVQANNFTNSVNEVITQFKDDPEFAEILTAPLMKKLSSAAKVSAERGGMTYNTMRALRSQIGKAINQNSLIPDVSQAELKQVYGALSDDVMMAAKSVNDDAFNAAKRANTYWRAGRARLDDVLQPVVNKDLSHKIFEAAMQGARSSGQKLRAIKKSIPANEWNGVVAQQIREMGRATPGKQDATGELFSPATFLTNYNRLSKDAKKVLFTGIQYKGLEKSINDLVTTSAALKDVSQMANTSGTAQQLMYMQMLTGGLGGLAGMDQGDSAAGGAIGGIAISLATPWAAAKLITNPKFVSWLADAGKAAVTQNGIGAHLGRLSAIAENNKDIAPAIYEYMRAISINKETPNE